jgi:hypothetical protein
VEEWRGVHGATAPQPAAVACRPEVEDEGGVGQLGQFGRVGQMLSGLARQFGLDGNWAGAGEKKRKRSL